MKVHVECIYAKQIYVYNGFRLAENIRIFKFLVGNTCMFSIFIITGHQIYISDVLVFFIFIHIFTSIPVLLLVALNHSVFEVMKSRDFLFNSAIFVGY